MNKKFQPKQHRDKPLVTTPMEVRTIERITELKEKYQKTKSDIINKALEMGLNELEFYYQMERKFFTKQKEKVEQKFKQLNEEQ